MAAAVVSLGALYLLVPAPAYSYAAQKAATAVIKSFALEEEALAAKANALVEARRTGRIDDLQLGERIEA